MIILDKKGKVPLYYQLIDGILKEIENGKLPEHTKLFTERELCELYNISRATVRQAVSILEKDGHIYRVQGRGTFIAPKKIEQTLENFYSFGDEVKKIGMKPSSKIISLEIIALPGHISKKIGYMEAEKFYKLIRVRLADNEPMVYEETYIPYGRFPNLKSNEIEEQGLYPLFKEVYDAKLDYATESFFVCAVGENVAKYIREVADTPAMRLERITYEKDKVVEYTESVIKGSKFKFTATLKNI